MTPSPALQGDARPPVVIRLPAEPDSLAIVRQAVTGVAEVLGLPEERLDDLKVAVTEACTNVVLHAYAGDTGAMEVRVRQDDRSLVVTVRDEGAGIVPRAEKTSPGLGLGLQMIAALADDVRIAAGDGGGTSVRMAFLLD
ncbi:MAG TPA: ATP-binding protein [Miltoncostaeaceae bacterium]|nr:ATP-binding protein [Miltoncostaeaceae bacterium]